MSFREGNNTQVHATVPLIFHRDHQQMFKFIGDEASCSGSEPSMNGSTQTEEDYNEEFHHYIDGYARPEAMN